MKWITIEDAGGSHSGLTKVWNVLSIKERVSLGVIKWLPAWRRYVFIDDRSVFEQDCLRDIANFIEEETRKHKDKT